MSLENTGSAGPSAEFDELVAMAISQADEELGNNVIPPEYRDDSNDGTDDTTSTDTVPEPEVVAKESPAEKTALERITAREAALAAKEKEFELQLSKYRQESGKSINLDELSQLGSKSPAELFSKLGLDRDFVMDVLIAEKLGDKAPPALKEKLRDYHLRKEIDSIRAERDNERRLNETQAYYNKVSNEALEYVTKGIDEKKTPVSHAVSKADSATVHSLVLQEIERDARVRAASGDNGELLSYSEAVERLEKVFSVVQKALAGSNVSGVTNGKKPAVRSPTPPVTRPDKDKPVDEIAALEQKGLEDSMKMFHRLEARRKQ